MRRKLIHWFGLTGIVALLSYAAAVIFAPLRYPGYNWICLRASRAWEVLKMNDMRRSGPGQCGDGASAAILETPRLRLREMNPGDFDALFRVLGDPETMWHYPYTFDGQHVRDWIQRNMNRYRKHGFGLWAVCLKDSGEMIGDCGLTLQNIEGEMLPEIGYHIRRDCQRQGYASEAARGVRDWAFLNTDYPALYSYCKYTNLPSIRTAESIGMRFDREYPDAVNGTTHVSVIFREDWPGE